MFYEKQFCIAEMFNSMCSIIIVVYSITVGVILIY